MKTKQIIFAALFFIFSYSLISAQEKTELANPNLNEKCNELIVQLNSYILNDNQNAKKLNLSNVEYGKYVAKQFIDKGLANNLSYFDFTNACLYPYNCLLKTSDYQVIEYSSSMSMTKEEKFMPILFYDKYNMETGSDMLTIKCCKPIGLIKAGDNTSFITKEEYIEYYTSAMKTIGEYIGYNYYTKVENDNVYTIVSK